MDRSEAVTYLLKNHVPRSGVSVRYGSTEFSRAVVAWNAAKSIAVEDEITTDLLDEIILSVDKGDAVIAGLNRVD